MIAPLLIADVPWLLYRSYFGLPKSIVDEHGQPVNALLGTVNALLLAAQARPGTPPARTLIACFGAEQAEYRVRLYPPYHAHRDPMPAELAAQWQRAPDLLSSFGWTIGDGGQLEADDVIHSYALTEARAGGRAQLLTGDRDLYQTVSERVVVLELAKGKISGEIGPDGVRERYGIAPALVPDFIALRGDPSDGLPGAPGIGAKTAAELLRLHGSLEGVLGAAQAADDELRPRIAATLREHAEQLRAFKQIATLVLIDVRRPPDATTDHAAGARAARALGMKRLAERLQSATRA
jgi:5'-3' exonuclease